MSFSTLTSHPSKKSSITVVQFVWGLLMGDFPCQLVGDPEIGNIYCFPQIQPPISPRLLDLFFFGSEYEHFLALPLTNWPTPNLIDVTLAVECWRCQLKLDQGCLGMSNPLKLVLKPNLASNINCPLSDFYLLVHWSVVPCQEDARHTTTVSSWEQIALCPTEDSVL